MRTLGSWEVKSLAQACSASQWQSQGSDSGLLAPKPQSPLQNEKGFRDTSVFKVSISPKLHHQFFPLSDHTGDKLGLLWSWRSLLLTLLASAAQLAWIHLLLLQRLLMKWHFLLPDSCVFWTPSFIPGAGLRTDLSDSASAIPWLRSPWQLKSSCI